MWKPKWELCEPGQCDFPGKGPYGADFGKSIGVILQRCRTETGEWLYMAVTDLGGIALAIGDGSEGEAT